MPTTPSCHFGKLSAGLLLASFLVSGFSCEGPGESKPVTSASDPALTMIAESTSRASKALAGLQELESRKAAQVAPGVDLSKLPSELQQPVTLSWDGPVTPVTRLLSGQAGYTFNEVGKPPAVPILVQVRAQNTPLASVLVDIGHQAGQHATLRLSPGLVELVYAAQ